MAPPPYSYPKRTSSNGFASAFSSSHSHRADDSSLIDDCRALAYHAARSLWHFWHTRGRRMSAMLLLRSAQQLRQNLTMRRLLSFPHLLVLAWVFVLLWGERWVFHTRVETCHWSNWEKWVSWSLAACLLLCASSTRAVQGNLKSDICVCNF